MTYRYAVVGLAFVTSAVTVRAQDPADVVTHAPLNIEFMTAPIAFDAEPVTGAPYSAEAITDIVQQLADGNRIVRQSKAQIARDSQGRTRREEGLAMFGPLVNGPRPDELRTVQISDPTTGSMVMLDFHNRTAHRMPGPPRTMLRNKIAGVNTDAGGNVEKVPVEKLEMAVPPPAGARGGIMLRRMGRIPAMQADKPVVESLGTEFMEGIAVDGTRTTQTIPAGQIGNELPIRIVSERWFSQDLKVLVMSRQSDPRFGETTYRLTNITRAEPPAHLFEVPADFTSIDPAANRGWVIERRNAR